MVTLPEGTLLDKYTIDGLLGQGGFGVTYLAEDPTLHKKFAIKEYFPQSWASRDISDSVSVTANNAAQGDYRWGLERFIDEARTLARFRHPAIVNVNAILEENNTAYMVLDYEDGMDFRAWLEQLGRPPTQAELDAIVGPLLDALSVIHRNNILHRDIAPDNIYIRRDGTPVLLDFGSAREAIGHRSRTLSAIIKSGYSPQEQYTTDGRGQGPWTDIYALGATLYRAVTGVAPPEAPARAIGEGIAPAADAAQAGYRAGFLAAIDHALERHHEDRPQSVAEWREELFAERPVARAPASTPASGPAAVAPPPPPPRPQSASGGSAARWVLLALLVATIAGGGYYFAVFRPAELQRRQDLEARLEQSQRKEREAQEKIRRDEADKRRREQTAWDRARSADDIAGYRAYLAAHPDGAHAADANRRIAALQRAERQPSSGDLERGGQLGSAREYLERGIRFRKAGQLDRAIQDYNEALRLDPRFASAYNSRGIAYYHKGDYDRAIQDYNEALRLSPRYAAAYNNRGNAYDEKGQYDRAIQDYDEALKINPKYAIAFNNRGVSYRNKNQFARAIEDYDQAIRYDPKYAAAYNNRGISYRNLKQYDRAIQDYDEAIRLDPNYAGAYNNRGIVYHYKKQYDRAIQDYTQAIRLRPRYAKAYNNRALSHERLGRRSEAIADFRKALEVQPGYTSALNGLKRLGASR